MKRLMITIDECMSMSKEQINQFLDKDENLLREGLIDKNQPNIDFMGMTDEQIADKYGFKEEVNEQRSIRLKKIIKESVNSILNELYQTKYNESINLCKAVLNENKSYPSMLNNRKRKHLIRLTESDLVNIVKQCLFESTRGTSLLTESAQDKRVQKYLKSKGYSDYNKRMEIIGKTKHDIPNIRLDNDKFLLGCLRMACDGLLRDEQSYRYVAEALKHIHTDGHTNEFDENLNGMTPDELHEMFRGVIKQNSAKDRERSANRVFEDGSNYTIIPINSFEEAKPYGHYTSWCVTHGQDHFDDYTKYGSRFYFCLRDGFQSVERDDTNAPINEWGLSMIAVNIDMEGNVCYVTTRYNHDHNGENNPQLETPEQLENVLNVPFYQTFKPYTRQELLDMGVVPFDMVQELLDSGKDPEEVFQEVDYLYDDFAKVELNDKYNFINEEGKLVLDRWLDEVDDFYDGFATVKLNDKRNFIDTEGKLLSDTWFDYASYFYDDGFALIELNGKYNFINNGEGKLVSDKWFDEAIHFNGYAAVKLDDKYNFINLNVGGKFISETWYDYVTLEYPAALDRGDAKVKLNNKWNFINKEGKLLSPTWFDAVDALRNGYAMVKLNNKWNFINKEGKLVSPNQWFDNVQNFFGGRARVRLDDKWCSIDTEGNIFF